ncbi:MAG: 50S ribosomal protein L23 [Phycisphaeraceae bacterium]|nr:50S ribosomal protein L23 [Phycisphaeraceae bacterium]
MHDIHIIKQPILTEKSTFAMNEQKKYSFLVAREASKDQIKQAVERLYKVRVTGVNTQNRKGKAKRMRYGVVQEPTTKKATVTLHADDVIELF